MSAGTPRLSVVVPVWNRAELVGACLRSVERAAREVGEELELVVVDDASSDGAAELVEREFPAARLLRNEENRGFAASANRGLAAASAELLLLLNSDTEVEADALGRLVGFLERHPTHAGVVPQLVGPSGEVQPSCMAFPRMATPLFFGTPLERWRPRSRELRRYFQRDFDHVSERDVEQPPAACWLLRRASWEAVGPFDESLELFFNDVDWCRRLAEQGGRLRFLPEARVLHHGGASTAGRADFLLRWQTDRLRYQRKHLGRIAGLFTKLCVGWTFADWWWDHGRRDPARARVLRGDFLRFLRA